MLGAWKGLVTNISPADPARCMALELLQARIPKDLKARLRRAAARDSRSITFYVTRALERELQADEKRAPLEAHNPRPRHRR